MRAIYWFKNDLRVQDNPALAQAAKASRQLLLVYFLPTQPAWCNLRGMGKQRQRFLVESLKALDNQLARQADQSLLVLQGAPEQLLPELCQQLKIDCLFTTRTAGTYEGQTLKTLQTQLNIPLQLLEANTLFQATDIASLFTQIPTTFSKFRQQVEKSLPPIEPIADAPDIPARLACNYHSFYPQAVQPHISLPIQGGTCAGERRLQQFLSATGGIRRYKATRNGLDPLAGTSTLSPWLSDGSLAVRSAYHAIKTHEASFGANESTYWLYFELLWREYFYWKALEDGAALFRLGGRLGQPPLTTFDSFSFARWCNGETNYPLVNALMHQLVATGWMSNRGRQIVASCLVNELQLDWRYGAAFFEKHLIDYDTASNYGNWQYIAGVGSDPRGGRHFNLDKQTQQYDPNKTFIEKWDGMRPQRPDYAVDAADWPLSAWQE